MPINYITVAIIACSMAVGLCAGSLLGINHALNLITLCAGLGGWFVFAHDISHKP